MYWFYKTILLFVMLSEWNKEQQEEEEEVQNIYAESNVNIILQ